MNLHFFIIYNFFYFYVMKFSSTEVIVPGVEPTELGHDKYKNFFSQCTYPIVLRTKHWFETKSKDILLADASNKINFACTNVCIIKKKI